MQARWPVSGEAVAISAAVTIIGRIVWVLGSGEALPGGGVVAVGICDGAGDWVFVDVGAGVSNIANVFEVVNGFAWRLEVIF